MGAAPENADEPKGITFKIQHGSPKDLPLLYAHQLVVNFTGNEFYVTVYRTAPEPWTVADITTIKTEIEAVPLARFAFSPVMWLAAIEACSDQIRKLHAEGSIADDQLGAAKRMLGQ